MTTIDFGSLSSASAPVEETILVSSISTLGRDVGTEPVAIKMREAE